MKNAMNSYNCEINIEMLVQINDLIVTYANKEEIVNEVKVRRDAVVL